MTGIVRSLGLIATIVMAGFTASGTASAEDAMASPEAAIVDIGKTWGFVPGFVKAFPPSALPGAWAELKALEGENTALSAKQKALIGIAVAAQIPCQFCVWIDTKSAYLAGATDQEVQEAVATAAIARHWSTVFHGNQIDFETFKAEFAGLAKAADEARAKTMAGQ